jgi:hypothetical protein
MLFFPHPGASISFNQQRLSALAAVGIVFHIKFMGFIFYLVSSIYVLMKMMAVKTVGISQQE